MSNQDNMALTYGYEGIMPNFKRDQFETLASMKEVTNIDEGHISFCLEDKKNYQFLSSNEVNETTGKWRPFVTGGSNENPIVFLESIQEFQNLPEVERNKPNKLYVIGKRD